MQERRRGDISGAKHGDFVDWDNPEDLEDDTPEGYYDDEEDDGSYIPGPDDPDYDLSEAAGYSGCFDLELIGPRIEEEGYASACRRSIDALGTMLESLGA